MRGRDAVIAFYRPLHEHVRETVEIQFLLRAGDVIRITSFMHYDLDSSGRFSQIRIGSYGEAVKQTQ